MKPIYNQQKGLGDVMSMIPTTKIYICEEGGSCFVCVGKENCTHYRETTFNPADEAGYFYENLEVK